MAMFDANVDAPVMMIAMMMMMMTMMIMGCKILWEIGLPSYSDCDGDEI